MAPDKTPAPRTAGPLPPAGETEAGFQKAVTDLATLRGWLWYHTHDSRRSNPGFPDLVLIRGKRLLFVELKRSLKERLRPEQQVWKDRLGAANYVHLLWSPELWDTIQNVLW